MLYATGSRSIYGAAGDLLSSIDGASPLAKRMVETSNPGEINKNFLTEELKLASSSTSSSSSSIPTRASLRDGENGSGVTAERQSVRDMAERFQRPKGPGKKTV